MGNDSHLVWKKYRKKELKKYFKNIIVLFEKEYI